MGVRITDKGTCRLNIISNCFVCGNQCNSVSGRDPTNIDLPWIPTNWSAKKFHHTGRIKRSFAYALLYNNFCRTTRRVDLNFIKWFVSILNRAYTWSRFRKQERSRLLSLYCTTLLACHSHFFSISTHRRRKELTFCCSDWKVEAAFACSGCWFSKTNINSIFSAPSISLLAVDHAQQAIMHHHHHDEDGWQCVPATYNSTTKL